MRPAKQVIKVLDITKLFSPRIECDQWYLISITIGKWATTPFLIFWKIMHFQSFNCPLSSYLLKLWSILAFMYNHAWEQWMFFGISSNLYRVSIVQEKISIFTYIFKIWPPFPKGNFDLILSKPFIEWWFFYKWVFITLLKLWM